MAYEYGVIRFILGGFLVSSVKSCCVHIHPNKMSKNKPYLSDVKKFKYLTIHIINLYTINFELVVKEAHTNQKCCYTLEQLIRFDFGTR